VIILVGILSGCTQGTDTDNNQNNLDNNQNLISADTSEADLVLDDLSDDLTQLDDLIDSGELGIEDSNLDENIF